MFFTADVYKSRARSTFHRRSISALPRIVVCTSLFISGSDSALSLSNLGTVAIVDGVGSAF